MALDVVGRDGGSLDSSFQRLNDAMALASKRSAQRRSSTPFTANVVSDCNRSPFDWTRNRGLIFSDYFIESCMGPFQHPSVGWVGWHMPLSTTVGLSRIRNHGLLGRPLSYAAPNRGSVGRALDHASVMFHPMDMASLIWVAQVIDPTRPSLGRWPHLDRSSCPPRTFLYCRFPLHLHS